MTYGIRVTTSQELVIGTTFYLAVEISKRIECIHNQGKEAMMRDKRPHRSGSFSGTSSRGWGQFGRGHHGRPDYSAQHVARGAVARTSLSSPIPSYFRALPMSF